MTSDHKQAVYEVKADPATGEWLSRPFDTGERATELEWSCQEDTETATFDTYQHFPMDADGQKSVLGTTRILRTIWA